MLRGDDTALADAVAAAVAAAVGGCVGGSTGGLNGPRTGGSVGGARAAGGAAGGACAAAFSEDSCPACASTFGSDSAMRTRPPTSVPGWYRMATGTALHSCRLLAWRLRLLPDHLQVGTGQM